METRVSQFFAVDILLFIHSFIFRLVFCIFFVELNSRADVKTQYTPHIAESIFRLHQTVNRIAAHQFYCLIVSVCARFFLLVLLLLLLSHFSQVCMWIR